MELRGTTIVAVRTEAGVAVAGDGQVTLGQAIAVKHTARKVRRMYKDKVVIGFALVKKGVWIHNIVAPVAEKEAAKK